MTGYNYWDALTILGLSENQLDCLLAKSTILDPTESATTRFWRVVEAGTHEPLRWTLADGQVVFPTDALEAYLGLHLSDSMCFPWQLECHERYRAFIVAQMYQRERTEKMFNPSNWE